ncbi:cytidylyltransferase domain-containing protein [Acetobacterium malicum]|uniref:cytidylyltransferase domain-containing protein n=1 Tax=Acetobacterium malicum TaxID=52692 RepID=UPI0004170E75|nr:glycosyltransferase family protein [Acetobacterium dehalogenans]
MNIGVIIQARMGSTRLPGKVMRELFGKTVLGHVIERVQQAKKIDTIIIATTKDPCDDIIEEEALKYRVKVFRGSEDNVLERYYLAAKKNMLDVVVRVTSDCPLIDPHIMDQLIDIFTNNDFDMVSNSGADYKKRTIPQGFDVEVFSFASLEEAYLNADQLYQREHVTPYIYEHCQKCFFQRELVDHSNYRWTLDTQEDFWLIQEVYKRLYHQKHDFYLDELLKLFEEQPSLIKINDAIIQKKIK